MKLAVLLDPIQQLKPYKDTSIAMIKRAQELGWSCAYFTQEDLFCRQGRAFARVYELSIGEEHSKDWATIKDLGEQPLGEFDIILMRKDPPFNIEYIYTTYFLELAEREGVLVSNNPQSLRDANEKFFTLNFPQCCPTTLVSRNIKKLKSFWEEHQQVIFKPLEGMGGNSVFHVEEHGRNLAVILEVLTNNQTQTIIAQRYIPEIKTAGDKRILLINGEPVPYALARIPAQGDLRGNLAAGARGEVVAITARDRWIAEQIAPSLKAKREIQNETKLDIAGDYLLCLEKMRSGL
ncbi:MAG: glutathione synthase [Legionella longbeachae]|nr:glutathione synthase [Legionella longbeachae]